MVKELWLDRPHRVTWGQVQEGVGHHKWTGPPQDLSSQWQGAGVRGSFGRRTLVIFQIPSVKSLYGLAPLYGLLLSRSGQVPGAFISFGQQVMRMESNLVQPHCLLLLSSMLCQWMMRGIFYVRWDVDVSERRSLILRRHDGGPGGLRP